MMSRPIALAVLGTMLSSLPAAADRRTKRRVADVEDQKEEIDSDGPEAKAVLPIKLDDLIEVAVRLSPDLARAKNDRAAAQGQAVASRKDQQWQLTLAGQYDRYATSPDVDVGAFQVAAEDKLAANLAIGRNIPTGGNVKLELGITRTIRELQIPGDLANQVGVMIPSQIDMGDSVTDTYAVHQAQVKLSFKQPLIQGFGSDVALAQEHKADLQMTDATVKTQIAAEDLLKDIVSGYWELAYSAYEVDTRAVALELAKKQDVLTRTEVRAGTTPQNSLGAVTYEIAVRNEALLAAQNEFEKKSLDLRKKVGLELSRRDIVMRPGDAFEIGDDEWDVEDVLARSRKSNRRLASLILQKRAADVDITVAKDGMRPKADLTLSGALIGSGNTADAAFTAATQSDGYQVMANLTVTVDIGGAAKGNYDTAVARRQRVVVDEADTQRSIEADIVHAVHQVTGARARVTLADSAITSGEDNVKAEKASFQAGKATNFEVMQRQTQLVEARLRRGRAVADYHIAVAQLQHLSGMILDQYRVNVRPSRSTR